MNWRTQTRPNGKRDHREVVTGWAAWLGRAVSVLALLKLLWFASARVTSIENKLDSQALELPDKIAAAIAANAKTDGYVSRDEWLTDKQAQDAAVSKLTGKVDVVIERQYRTNYLLEKLPGAKEKDR